MHLIRGVPAVKTYRINECFYSPQGEGVRAGTMNVFVRFSGCNMRCAVEPGPKSPGGFDCDTEFESGRPLTLDQIHDEVMGCQDGGPAAELCKWLVLTGGEPGLQVDREFCDYFHQKGFKLAIETNGSVELPFEWFGGKHSVDPGPEAKEYFLDWITVSPKVAEHCIRQKFAHEVKYVRGHGQAIPKTVVEAEHYLISPAFNGLELDRRTLAWCLQLVKDNPTWRLSTQLHKAWQVR
jgi:7-carboxy-7-deazaguanine synthase